MATVVDRWTAEPDKRNGKRWDVRWRDEQHRSRRKAFKLRADAERFKTDIEHALSRGTYRDPRDGERPFGEYATTWFESQTHLRNSTRALYDGALRNHLLPFAGHTALNRITADTGRALLASEIAPRMKQVSVQLMRRILNDAVAEMLIPFNPLHTIRIPKHQPSEPRSLTLDELNALVAHTHPHFQTLVRSAAILGLRQGELFGLHPRNLDLHLGTVRVVEQLRTDVRPPQRGALKTQHSRRTVEIPELLKHELEQQLLERSSTDFVFTAIEGGPIHKSTFLRRYWAPARNAAGLDGFRFHELRHTAVSLAIDANAHARAIQARLGHGSISVTMDTYGHLMPGTDRTVADSINRLLVDNASRS